MVKKYFYITFEFSLKPMIYIPPENIGCSSVLFHVLSDDLHRPQFQQHLKTIIDIPRIGHFQKRECRHVAEFQRCHAQDDGGQVAADDFGVGEFGAAIEIFF